MKIKNETHWKTSDLRKIITEALRRNECVEGKISKKYRDRNLVTVRYTKRLNYSGKASIGFRYMILRVPRFYVDPCKFAWLFTHELLHNREYRHCSFGSFMHYHEEQWDWAKEYKIRAERKQQ